MVQARPKATANNQFRPVSGHCADVAQRKVVGFVEPVPGIGPTAVAHRVAKQRCTFSVTVGTSSFQITA